MPVVCLNAYAWPESEPRFSGPAHVLPNRVITWTRLPMVGRLRVFQAGSDFDGTIVAQVFLDSGVYLNERQIQEGMAWNAVDDGYDLNLSGAEESAQTAAAGIWGGDFSAVY